MFPLKGLFLNLQRPGTEVTGGRAEDAGLDLMEEELGVEGPLRGVLRTIERASTQPHPPGVAAPRCI